MNFALYVLRAFLSPSTENRGINMLLACHRCYQLPTFNDNCLECQDCNWHQWAEDENDAVSDALEAKQLIPIEVLDIFQKIELYFLSHIESP
jgi:hypothetical protein